MSSANEERRANRTERLFATILLLQNRPNMTSRDLAEHFGVSRRTIFRDLRALSESGVPYSEGGGYEILEGYQLPPLMLSAREAATLLIGTEFMKLQSDSSLRKDADDVALKIRTVLPREIREFVDQLRSSTVLDPYWYHALSAEEDESGKWYKLSEAVARDRKVIMEYWVASRDEVTQRRVNPLGLVYYTDHWNLIAWDHLRDGIRNFRIDRIRELYVLTEKFERPEGFDLEEYLKGEGYRGENRTIVLEFEKSSWARVRTTVPARLDEEEIRDDVVRITFQFDNLDYLANWLLRYGDSVRVVEPDDLVDGHIERARRLIQQY